MDNDIRHFFKTHKQSFDDADAFLASLNGRLTYYHHYEILAKMLEAEKRRGRYLALGFIGMSLLAAILILSLLKVPVFMALGNYLKAVSGADNLGIMLLCAVIAAAASVAGCAYVKVRGN